MAAGRQLGRNFVELISGRAYLMYPARFISRSVADCAAASAASTDIEPASAAENCWPTEVPMPWNSGIAAYCTPTYGTGLTVGLFGSAASIEARVNFANGATFR